ncbi:MAG: acireductone synthase [Spongiibacter sp.]|uniref:Enolase-phosphatase E1 n=1 Tax=Spongiibacter thalassae TaxID=2721624 RepID=A0ABX1GCG7_9GAMM|nr:acireductone synthase [Spongiibacter thalassae]MDX1505654.1 acireductone synthase [Spongiibacter sp.]NKI16188.1 acireductone synthase [Spongiibacter thalassae]
MIKAIVTDIEGTTSSIDFVHEVLFPYSTAALPDYVRRHRGEKRVAALLNDVAARAKLSVDDTEGQIQQLLDWIAADKKITPLKSLQGLIWESGYRNGEFKAHVYADAVEQLKAWHQQGIELYVYSSGSIFAQKLFFGYSEGGDLRFLFNDYFDTTSGPKRDAASYRNIARSIDKPPQEILFLSDIVEELDAAQAANMHTVWVQREATGTALVEQPPHVSVSSFNDIAPTSFGKGGSKTAPRQQQQQAQQ